MMGGVLKGWLDEGLPFIVQDKLGLEFGLSRGDFLLEVLAFLLPFVEVYVNILFWLSFGDRYCYSILDSHVTCLAFRPHLLHITSLRPNPKLA